MKSILTGVTAYFLVVLLSLGGDFWRKADRGAGCTGRSSRRI